MIQENNTSDQNLQEEEEKKEKNSLKNEAIAFGGAAGVGACGAVVAEQVKEMELDLLKTTNEAGKPTGHGNMFENVVLRENAGARKINNLGSSSNPLLREKNGVDIRLADGTDIQAKCCYSAEKTVQSLMKNGKFRYEGQTIYVPKGQGEAVSKLLKEQGVDSPVFESKLTYQEIRKLCTPGWTSAKFDATNPKVMGAAALTAVVVGGFVYMYLHVNNPDKPWWKKALTATTFSAIAFGAVELLVVGYGQYKRM